MTCSLSSWLDNKVPQNGLANRTEPYLTIHRIDKYHQVLPSITQYCQVLPSIAKYCQVLPSIAKYCQVLPSFAKLCQVLPSIAKYCQVLPTIAKYHSVLILFNIFVGCNRFLSNIVGIVRYRQVLWRRIKSILTIQFLTVISQYLLSCYRIIIIRYLIRLALKVYVQNLTWYQTFYA